MLNTKQSIKGAMDYLHKHNPGMLSKSFDLNEMLHSYEKLNKQIQGELMLENYGCNVSNFIHMDLRKPKLFEHVLIPVNHKLIKCKYCDHSSKPYFRSVEDDEMHYNIKHWMPMPYEPGTCERLGV
jgi:hypothetical protein